MKIYKNPCSFNLQMTVGLFFIENLLLPGYDFGKGA
jgi:hypothetical protein